MSIVTAIAAGFLLGACGKPGSGATKTEPAGAARTIRALPEDHEFNDSGHLAAVDLEHGGGAQLLAVRRVWEGKETTNTHLGPGWSDLNLVRLTLIDADCLLVWRGGIGWRTAHRESDGGFAGTDGEKIAKTATGWTLEKSGGYKLTFDTEGRLLSEKTAIGPATNYAYDEKGNLASVGTSPENSLQYRYDQAGRRVIGVSGPEGLNLTYEYDAGGRLTGVTNYRQVKVAYRYREGGPLASAKDQFGNEFEPLVATAAAPAPAATAVATAPFGFLPQTRYEFDENGLVKSQTENGRSVSFVRDAFGSVTAVVSAEGRTECAYDAYGRITGVTGPDGAATKVEFNSLGLPVVITKPGGHSEKLTYDGHGRLLRREASASDWVEYSYDGSGRLIAERRFPAAETHYNYDAQDRVIMTKLPDGLEIRDGYDEVGRLVSESSSTGETRTWRYDAAGREIESVSPGGLKTTYAYDEKGRIISTSDPVHGTVKYRDVGGQRVFESESAGTMAVESSSQGRLLAAMAPGGGRTAFSWSPGGNLTSVTGPSGMTWSYQYGADDQLTGMVSPRGVRTAFSYDGAGRLATVNRGGIPWREFRRDAAGRIRQLRTATGPVADFDYDAAGRLNEIRLPEGSLAFTHEPNGRSSTVKGRDFEVREEYHPDGTFARRICEPGGIDLKLPRDVHGRSAGLELNGLKAAHAWDMRGRIERIDLPGGGTVRVTMDEAGRPAALAFSNGMTISVSCDKADRITRLKADAADGTTVFSERYTYDAAGNVSEWSTDAAPPRRMEYDKENRLTLVSDVRGMQRFGYDPDGNLSSLKTAGSAVPLVLDKLGRPLHRGPVTYKWNAAGCLTEIEDATGRTSLEFDAPGRLVRRSDRKGGTAFGYLPDGDRLWKQSPSGGKSWYAWLPGSLAGFKDGNGVTWMLVCLPGTDWPLAVCGSNGQTLFVVADRLHSTRRFLDQSGKVVAGFDFGPFGAKEAVQGEAPIVLYAGMMVEDNGLYYARQRYYDPQIARFISLDPLVGTPGEPATQNAYAYAANNPLRYRDPQGASTEGMAGTMLFDALTLDERNLAHDAADAMKNAERVLQSGSASAAEKSAASQALKASEATLQRMHERGRLRHIKDMSKLALERGMEDNTLTPIGRRSVEATLAQAEENLTSHVAGGPYRSLAGEGSRGLMQPGQVISKGSAAGTKTPTLVNPGAGRSMVPAPSTGGSMVPAPAPEPGFGGARRIQTPPAGEVIEMVQDANGVWRKAGGEAGESFIGGLWRGAKRVVGRVLPWMLGAATAYGVASDVKLVAELDYNAFKMYEAEKGSVESRKLAREIQRKLDEEIRRIAKEEPERLLPRWDGRPIDPNNPQEMDELIIDMHRNLTKKKNPFDGLIKPREQGREGLEEALATARGFINRAREMENGARNAQAKAVVEENTGRSKLASAATLGGVQAWASLNLDGLPVVANAVEQQTAGVRSQMKALQAAFDAMTAAGATCDAAAASTCELADKAAGASEEQVKQWQSQAIALLTTASGELNAAQARIDAIGLGLDALEKSTAELDGYSARVALTRAASSGASAFGATATAAMTDAQAAYDRAKALRESVPGFLAKMKGLADQAKAALAPFANEIEASSLLAQVDSLGQGVETPGLFDFASASAAALAVLNPVTAALNKIEQVLASVNIDGILASAHATLTEARALRASSLSPDRYRALQRASQCYARLQAAGKPMVAANDPPPAKPDAAETPAPPSPPETLTPEEMIKAGAKGNKAGGKVIVPNLAVFDNVGEMKAVLSHAGLIGTFSSGGKPPTKEKEFKFAGQSHAPNSMVDPGTTVVVTVYQKFDGTSSSDEEVTVPDLSGSASFEDTANIVRQRGLVHVLNAVDAPSKEKEKKFAGQSHAPNTKVKIGTPIVVSWYREFKAPAGDTVPKLTGLKLEQVDALLAPLKLKLGGVETSVNADKPEQVDRIFAQNPPEGSKIPENGLVTVKVYGSMKTADKPGGNPAIEEMVAGAENDLIGEYDGTLDGRDPIKVYIRRDGGKWFLGLRIQSELGGRTTTTELGGSGVGRTITVKDGVITNTHVVKSGGSGELRMILTVKVNGGQLVGSYQYSDTRGDDPAMHKNSTTNFTATRTK